MGIGNHEYLNSFINDSNTITENAGAKIDAPAHKAVMYDANGDVVLATDGGKAIGIILSSTLDPINKGDQVHILISAIGLLKVSGAIAKGDAVTVANGLGVKAATGDAVFGRAFTATSAAGQCVQIRI